MSPSGPVVPPRWDAHCHLEGAIYPSTLRSLQETGVLDEKILRRTSWEIPSDFTSFLTELRKGYGLFQRLKTYEMVLDGVLLKLEETDTAYAEIHLNLALLQTWKHSPLAVFESLWRVRCRRLESSGVDCRFVADVPWQFSPHLFDPLICAPDDFQSLGVLGLSIGGDERLANPRLFKGILEKGIAKGYRLMCHCGESRNRQVVDEVLRHLPVDRLVHAVAATHHQDLLTKIKSRRIGVDVCLTSNMHLLGFEYEAHPWRNFVEYDIPVAFGTDDPAIFQTDPAVEWSIAHQLVGDEKAFKQMTERSWASMALHIPWKEE